MAGQAACVAGEPCGPGARAQVQSPVRDPLQHALQSLTLTHCSLSYRDLPGPRDPAGSPLLLLHGSHGDWRHWSANLAALSSRHRVLVPDMPGFGASSSLPGEPVVEDLAQALQEFVQALALHDVTLVGFSFGCLVATALARALPDRIGRLMLVHPPGIGAGSPLGARIAAMAAEVARREGREAGMRVTLSRLMLADASIIDEALVREALSMSAAARLRTTAMSRDADLLPALSGLRQPLKVLIGDRDPYHAHDLDGREQRLAAVAGAGCVTRVPGAAHWLQRDQARAFEQLLLAFAQ